MIFQKCLIVGLLLSFANIIQAQNVFGATILAGINAAQLDGDDEAGYNKVGFNVGIRGDINFTEKIQVGMELTFSQRGSRSELGLNSNGSPQLQIDHNYIQAPILFRYSDWYLEEEDYYRVNAFAGFSYGRLLNAKAVNSRFDNKTELFKKNDIGLHIGASYKFTKRLAITLRFNRGLLKVFDMKTDPLISRSLISRYLTFRFEYSL